MLTTDTFTHPTLKTQKFEVKAIGTGSFFIIPTRWLDDNGVPFEVEGTFIGP